MGLAIGSKTAAALGDIVKRFVLIALVQLHADVATASGTTGIVTAHGLGPVKFGMTVTQFSGALQERMLEPQDPEDRGCYYLVSKKFAGVSFILVDGRLSRIDVRNENFITQDAIRVGTSADQVKLRYASRLIDEPHHYSGPEDRYLTLDLSPVISVRFETSASKIDKFYVGYKAQVQYVEGCL